MNRVHKRDQGAGVNNTTIFRRTALGQEAFANAKAALTQAERTLLIMIDGRRPLVELQKLSVVIGDCDGVLTRLSERGLVEMIATEAALAATPEALAASLDDNQQATHEQFERARKSAARFINQTLGTYGEKIALLVERSKTTAELREQLVAAERIIGEFKGANAALEFNFVVKNELAS
jgi:hypothetical protein